MRYRKIKLHYKGKSFELELGVCGFFRKAWGLMFKSKKSSQALLFEFKKPVKMPIHSEFVFFPFIAIWLDKKNKIIEYQIIKPFKFNIRPEKPFIRLIEIPFSDKYSKITETLVGSKTFK